MNNRLTEPVPTRTGVIGHLAAALGLPRGWQGDGRHGWLNDVDLWCRVDRAGVLEKDYHTVSPPTEQVAEVRRHQLTALNGEYPDESATDWTVPYGNGVRWHQKGEVYTMLTDRHYIADAEFLVAVSHPDDARVAELSAAVYSPKFLTYLGRKAHAAVFPYHLGVRHTGPVAVLATLPTTSKLAQLPIHELTDLRNPVSDYVTPPKTTDPLTAWKAAA